MRDYKLWGLAAAMMLMPVCACGSDGRGDEPVDPSQPEVPGVSGNWRPADGLALVTDSLSDDMWFSTGTLRTTSAVMQSFDIDFAKNLIYYSQLNNQYRLYISWSEPNATAHKGVMQLHYFGHGGNFTVEQSGDDRYIWISNYASKNAKGEYWGSQLVSRVPIKDGATVKPWDCTDNYYFDGTNLSVGVDFDNDRLAVLDVTSGVMRTYCLSALQALPVETVTLEPMTYGGDKAPDELTTKTFEVQARNCTRVKPLGQFQIKREPGIAWQGFEVCGDVIYQTQGNGNNNDGVDASKGYLLVFKIDGTPLLERTRVGALLDLKKLADMGITDTGYMEPEGVKVRNGVMYCGYASKNSANERRGTLFKYSPAQSPAMTKK